MRLLFYLILSFLCLSVQAQEKNHYKKKGLKILLISDLNDSYGTVGYSDEVKQAISKIKDIQPDIILCAGDMVAGQKRSLTMEQLEAMWEGFRKEVLNPIAELKIPFAFTMGNHDASPNFHNDRAAASAFWNTNKEKLNLKYSDSTYFPYYYSYIENDIFFISWDASSSIVTDEVKTWMQKELSSPLAKKANARILMGHLPLYAIVEAKNKPGEVINNADEMAAFLENLNINMYISGHQHAYFPGYKNNLLLLNNGCLGGGPRALLGDSKEGFKSYTIIEIKNKKGFKNPVITGFHASNHEPVIVRDLPDTIKGFNGSIYKYKN